MDNHVIEHVRQIIAVVLGFFGCFGHGARDGEDRAFDRLNHAFVSGVAGLAQGVWNIDRRHGLFGIETAGKAAPQLRQDHARVAARAHQGAVRDGLGNFADILFG